MPQLKWPVTLCHAVSVSSIPQTRTSYSRAIDLREHCLSATSSILKLVTYHLTWNALIAWKPLLACPLLGLRRKQGAHAVLLADVLYYGMYGTILCGFLSPAA